MPDNKDYSKLTLEELLTEEKKIKKSELISAVLIGFLIGVMVYGVAKSGFGFLYLAIPLLLIAGVYKNSQIQKHRLKKIQTEINNKNTK
jgi:F0F1-type ATP synthase assembly protein I